MDSIIAEIANVGLTLLFVVLALIIIRVGTDWMEK